jgi:hypothetical protein
MNDESNKASLLRSSEGGGSIATSIQSTGYGYEMDDEGVRNSETAGDQGAKPTD